MCVKTGSCKLGRLAGWMAGWFGLELGTTKDVDEEDEDEEDEEEEIRNKSDSVGKTFSTF